MDINKNQQVEAVVDVVVDPKEGATIESPTPSPTSRSHIFPTWSDLLAIFGLFFLAQVIARFIIALVLPTDIISMGGELTRSEEYELGFQIFLYSIVSLPLTLFMILMYRLFRGGKAWVVRYSMRGFDPTIILWGVILLLSLTVVIEPIMVLLPDAPKVMGRGVFLLLAVAVVAPVFEELICRGVILEAVRSKRGAWAACVVSALIFAMIHVHLQLVLNAFVVGLLLGFIYLRTNSLFAPIMIHAINNLLSYLLLIFGLRIRLCLNW